MVFVSTAFVATLPSYHKIGDSSSNSVMVRYATVNLVLLWLAYVVMVEPQLYKPRHCRNTSFHFSGNQAAWLLAAYQLEFLGKPTYTYIFLASIAFFLTNCHIIRRITRTFDKDAIVKCD